jgi:cytochrome c-type biogenesis protein CcmH/NrfG
MSPPRLAQLVYDQAQKALEQQERQVYELRQRTGTLLAAAALIASFFGTAAVGRDGGTVPVVLAGVALVITVLSGLYVLYPHQLDFALDARRLYDHLVADEHNSDEVFLSLAFGLRDQRAFNGRTVDRIGRCVAIAAVALGLQIACWTSALALG